MADNGRRESRDTATRPARARAGAPGEAVTTRTGRRSLDRSAAAGGGIAGDVPRGRRSPPRSSGAARRGTAADRKPAPDGRPAKAERGVPAEATGRAPVDPRPVDRVRDPSGNRVPTGRREVAAPVVVSAASGKPRTDGRRVRAVVSGVSGSRVPMGRRVAGVPVVVTPRVSESPVPMGRRAGRSAGGGQRREVETPHGWAAAWRECRWW